MQSSWIVQCSAVSPGLIDVASYYFGEPKKVFEKRRAEPGFIDWI